MCVFIILVRKLYTNLSTHVNRTRGEDSRLCHTLWEELRL